MRRLLLVAVLGAAVLVPAAGASQSATPSLRGTVVAKDVSHRGLVVALRGGAVRTVVAPRAFAKTAIGRRVTITYRPVAGKLPLALSVHTRGTAAHALVRGTVVRLLGPRAILSAGGSALTVTMKAPKHKRALASAKSGPQVGDVVTAEVDIDDDGSLDATSIVAAPASTAPGASEGELEVRGKVTALSPLTVVTGSNVAVGCAVPAGVTLTVQVGDMIELKCDLIGGVWTVHVARGEDDQQGGDDEGDNNNQGGGSDEHGTPAPGGIAAGIEVRGTLTSVDPLTVTPTGGAPVTCTVPAGVSLAAFTAGSQVKMECRRSGDTLVLTELRAQNGGDGSSSGGETHSDSPDSSNSF